MVNETEKAQVSLEALRTVLNIVRYDGVRSPKKVVKLAMGKGLTENEAKAALRRIFEDAK